MIKKIVLFTVFFMMAAFAGGAKVSRAEGWYMRGAVGFERSKAAEFCDSDCTATDPPALFGCGNGSNGESLGVSGDFGSFPVTELSFGRQLLPWLRGDLGVQYLFHMDYEGQANFLSVGRNQPVSAEASSFSGMISLFLEGKGFTDIGMGRFEPYIGCGVGLARNRISKMTYHFPENSGRHKLSVTPSGERTDFAFMLAVGTGIVLSDRIVLDIAYRYQDLGNVETDPGIMVMDILPSGIRIDGTSAPLRTHGVVIGLRYRFRR